MTLAANIPSFEDLRYKDLLDLKVEDLPKIIPLLSLEERNRLKEKLEKVEESAKKILVDNSSHKRYINDPSTKKGDADRVRGYLVEQEKTLARAQQLLINLQACLEINENRVEELSPKKTKDVGQKIVDFFKKRF